MLDEVYPETRHQRCWGHKTANALNALPKGAQAQAEKARQEIGMAEDRASAHKAFDHRKQERRLIMPYTRIDYSS